ncbi:MAG: hypothetical protein ACI4F1_12990 [Bariatricus sp.]
MKNGKKITAVLLAGTMSFTLVLPAFASDGPSSKEEVVYINLDAEGQMKEMNVVNIFGRGDVVDYGAYDLVEILNTNDEITQSGDKITFTTDSDRVYYQGRMSGKEIPWDISIRYYLDGKEYSAEELAGKSGKLAIHFKITKNEDCEGDFFENYALQAAFTLDTKKCENIVAENATLANVGSDKQISYTMLPGKGIDTTITADVKDFEMSAVSINGVPLSLDVEVDDEELLEQVTELLDAIEQIDDGTGKLRDGTAELQEGAEGELKSGVSKLGNGVSQLQSGAGELKNGGTGLNSGAADLKSGASSLNAGLVSLDTGITEIKKGLNELNEKSPELTEGSAEIYAALKQIQKSLEGVEITADNLGELSEASAEILSGITEISDGINQLYAAVSVEGYKAAMRGEDGQGVDELKAANSQAISQISPLLGQIEDVISNLQGYTDTPVIGEAASQAIDLLTKIEVPLSNLVTLLEKNNQCIEGTQTYIAVVNENIKPLADGAAKLKESYVQFDQAIQELVGTLSELTQNMAELKAGINTLVTEYQKLDTGINEYTSGVAQIVAGYSQVADGCTTLVKGSSELVEGSSQLYEGTTEMLSGIVEFYEATGSLKDGTGQLDEGVAELLAGIAELNSGAGELKDGTGELRDKTSGMDTQISDKIDEMLESITGGGGETVSFVSEKNTNVEAVQFVIQTEAVEIEEVEAVEEEAEEEISMWEKFLNLFR